MLPTYLLSKFAKQELVVTLSGDGADELFGGYERYCAMELSSKFNYLSGVISLAGKLFGNKGERSLGGRLSRLARVMNLPEDSRYMALSSKTELTTLNRLFSSKLSVNLNEVDDWFATNLNGSSESMVERCSEFDFKHYLPNDVLTKVDIASMRNAQEVRSPFLDTAVVEFAASLPWYYKQDGFKRKKIFETAFKELLPSEIFNRRKKGFGVPTAELLRSSWRKESEAVLLDGLATEHEWFNSKMLKTLWQEHQSYEHDHSYLLFSALIFELFLRRTNC